MPSLNVDETGNPAAPSIIFMHGIGVSGWMWKPQIAACSDFHCLNVDLPGHGKSNHIPWRSLVDTADQIATIIQTRATNGRAHVVGLSLGGHIALVLLEHHPDRVDRAVISGVGDGPMPNRVFLKPQLGLMSFLLKQGWFMRMQANSLRLSPDMQASMIESLSALSLPDYRKIWEEAVDVELSPVLQQVNVPTLVVAGSTESQLIKRAVDKIPQWMPNAEGRLAPGLGHGWNLQNPDLFNKMIRAWITGVPLPSALQTWREGTAFSPA